MLLDLILGDPVYPAHPVRLMGWTLLRLERLARKLSLDGYFGGILAFLSMTVIWSGGTAVLVCSVARLSHGAALAIHVFFVYSFLALHDLVRHGWRVEQAARREDLDGARLAVSRLVGRETHRMDFAACRRAVIESLSENLTDGFVSPIFWYGIAGLPGIVLFKVASTMDSMVGYKTPQYLRFGWCGARLDDLMNWLPARVNWLMITIVAALIPKCSAEKALRIGWTQHALLPSPNSGWSEAATAGAIQRKLIGQIWKRGKLVTDLWMGDAVDVPAGSKADVPRAAFLLTATGLTLAVLAMAAIFALA